MTSARRSARALRRRTRLRGSARIARSMSRLNSAAPYNTHAWPPMRRARTRCSWIEERTLRIGLGIKRSSQHQVGMPQFFRFAPAPCRSQAVPFCPLFSDKIIHGKHAEIMPEPVPPLKRRMALQPFRDAILGLVRAALRHGNYTAAPLAIAIGATPITNASPSEQQVIASAFWWEDSIIRVRDAQSSRQAGAKGLSRA